MIEVTLTWYEKEMACLVGGLRTSESIKRNLNQAKGSGLRIDNEEARYENDYQGAAAELAVAKALNRYWHGSVNVKKDECDIGDFVEVRSTHYPHGALIVRDNDIDERLYVLVIGQIPNFKVIGFIEGYGAKQQKWRSTPRGRGNPAYFVPQNELIPIEQFHEYEGQYRRLFDEYEAIKRTQ